MVAESRGGPGAVGDGAAFPAPGSAAVGAPPALRRPLMAADGDVNPGRSTGTTAYSAGGGAGATPAQRPAGVATPTASTESALWNRALLLTAALLGAAAGLACAGRGSRRRPDRCAG